MQKDSYMVLTHETKKESRPARKNMYYLLSSLYVVKEEGKDLGRSKVLQR